jgi:putative ABC transport system permease protein
MLLYNLRLAWMSVRRHPVLSSLIVLGIALGVAVATTFITLYHVLAQDPLPGQSDKLHYVRLNSWGGQPPGDGSSFIPDKITYRDYAALRRSEIPTRQTATAEVQLIVRPAASGVTGDAGRPFRQAGRIVSADFFAMFQVPFRYGSAWDRAADAKPEAVAVIGAALNDRLFGGEDSVGRTVRFQEQDFRVVGVLDHWQPAVRSYDMVDSPLGNSPDEIYLPFEWIAPLELVNSGSSMSWQDEDQDATFVERLQSSERLWVQYWVELPDAARREAFASLLTSYVAEQHRLGRFPVSQDSRLTPLVALMEEKEVVPPQAKALALISVLFLTVAAVNLIGLFLGKFLARAPIVGVRRALGASRRAIFVQHLVECELVALAGGVLGLALSFTALRLINRVDDDLAMFHLDGTMVAAALLLALAAGAIAGLYPAWRICAIPPARHLRNQ